MRRPTLSLCITTRSGPAQVHALLALVRPHVDEIVLSVDSRGDLDTLDACADLADRRLIHALDRNPNWLAAWILHQCSGDWILRLDDDELPSVALLDSLPDLIAERYVTVWRIQRRWLIAPDRYIVGFPWEAETVGRLVRNAPDLWHLDGGPHSEGRIEGERRFAEAPMYHLDTVLSPIERRRAKVARYSADGVTAVCEGIDVNSYYLPEDWAELETAPVPAVDRPAIARLLDPPIPPPSSGESAPVERADEDEIARWNRLPVRLGGSDGTVTVLSQRERCRASSRRHFQIEVENRGAETWWRMLPPQHAPVAVAWRWLDAGGGQVGPPESVGLTMTIFPGQTVQAWIAPETPADDGDYVLEVQLARHGTTRFGESGRTAVTVCREDEPLLPDSVPLESVRELELIERERAVERVQRAQHSFMATRRYRFAAALARPLDRVRALMGKSRG